MPLSGRTSFYVQASDGPVAKCWRCALRHPPMLRRSAGISVVIGTVLTGINHGDALLAGEWTGALAWKIPLTYLVPFAVAAWGALVNSRVPGERRSATRT
jgi:hypothetical protein